MQGQTEDSVPRAAAHQHHPLHEQWVIDAVAECSQQPFRHMCKCARSLLSIQDENANFNHL